MSRAVEHQLLQERLEAIQSKRDNARLYRDFCAANYFSIRLENLKQGTSHGRLVHCLVFTRSYMCRDLSLFMCYYVGN